MNEPGFQGTTDEWRWPVVDANEPKGIRTIRGYVTIIKHCTKEGGSARFSIFFADSDGRPIQGLSASDFWMFYDAGAAALNEMGLHDLGAPRDIVGEIIC
jgi:hypothetical protein